VVVLVVAATEEGMGTVGADMDMVGTEEEEVVVVIAVVEEEEEVVRKVELSVSVLD
jgi:hypothetical protein